MIICLCSSIGRVYSPNSASPTLHLLILGLVRWLALANGCKWTYCMTSCMLWLHLLSSCLPPENNMSHKRLCFQSWSQNEKQWEQTGVFPTCWNQVQSSLAACSRATATDPWVKYKRLWFKLLNFGVVSMHHYCSRGWLLQPAVVYKDQNHERLKYLYILLQTPSRSVHQFASTAVTKEHKLSGSKNINLLSYLFGG